MTTIAHKNGIIAYDSRLTDNNIIMSDSYNKHIEKNSVHFFLTGSTCYFDEFCGGYFDPKTEFIKSSDVCALVVDGTRLYLVNIVEGLMKRSPVDYVDAIGSGCEFALAFMDSGKTAKEAVEATMKRDVGTGGTVHEFHIPI